MIEFLKEKLMKAGFHYVPAKPEQFLAFYKVENKTIKSLFVIHYETGFSMTKEQYELGRRALWSTFMQDKTPLPELSNPPYGLEMLTVLLCKEERIEEAKQLLAGEKGYWIADMTARNIMIFEDQPEDFAGAHDLIKSAMSEAARMAVVNGIKQPFEKVVEKASKLTGSKESKKEVKTNRSSANLNQSNLENVYETANPNQQTAAGNPYATANPNQQTTKGNAYGTANPNQQTTTGNAYATANPNQQTTTGNAYATANPNQQTASQQFYGATDSMQPIAGNPSRVTSQSTDTRKSSNNKKSAKKKKQRQNSSFRLPIMTILLILANVAMFFFLEWKGRGQDAGTVALQYGAMYEPNIRYNHEFYRLVTSMFIHFGMEHLIGNMVMLAALGEYVERSIGKFWFFVVYFGSGIAGNILSFLYNWKMGQDVLSAGASGAVFGLFAAFAILVIYAKLIKRNDKKNQGILLNKTQRILGEISLTRVALMIALSLYYGFTTAGVDNMAHIGGFIAGVGMSIVIVFFQALFRRKRSYKK